jgi:hypothetical protein
MHNIYNTFKNYYTHIKSIFDIIESNFDFDKNKSMSSPLFISVFAIIIIFNYGAIYNNICN